ncbi:putative methyltransferase NSUN7 [Spea bombifrons]|uniref:putative methyltransferase NSUN7 n=1 Tax=Spea bombifrons TaxID=233779 RepID=UPI0023494907|nr:putative methyltransferase NSUN7 [Spea bombifrons]
MSISVDNLLLATSNHIHAQQDSSLTLNSIDRLMRNSLYLTEKDSYPDRVFINAAKIFYSIHVRKPPDRILVKYGCGLQLSLPEYEDEKLKRWSYELAFNSVKYQHLIETMLLDSGFYHSGDLAEDMSSLVVVMLYDFQDRKFQPRYIYNKEDIIQEVQEVENLLFRYKTRLAASLARFRIKHNAPTIKHILPESVQKQEQRASHVPLYAWMNTAKASSTDVFNTLEQKGFSKVDSPSEFDGYNYCIDNHCQDLLIFPAQLKEELNKLELFADYKIVFQDKSQSLAVHSVKALLNLDDDIIVADPIPGFTLAHLSALTHQNSCNIYVCGIKSEKKKEELEELFANMECKNITILTETFTDINPADKMLRKAKVIMLMPQCSGSGVSDPVDFVLSGLGDPALLQDFSQGFPAPDKICVLANHQRSEMKHAMEFSSVQAIVYCTSSINPEENENVINYALELKSEDTRVKSYRLSPPVIPLCSGEEVVSASDNYFKIEPSDTTNGCFIAVLAREKDKSNCLSAKDVLARAAAKGLLEGVKTSYKKEDKKRKKQKEKAATVKATTPKATSSFKDTQTAKRRKEGRIIVLKPKQIVLPPLMMPFSSKQSVGPGRNPVPYVQGWDAGLRANSHHYFIPTVSMVNKPKATPPCSTLHHPKPWH